MKLSVVDLLLVNVDKLFTVHSLIGSSDVPFGHLVFAHIQSSVRAKLLCDVKIQ